MIDTWSSLLHNEKNQSYFKNILSFVMDQRKKGKVIFPDNADIFNAFLYCSFSMLKVVILGQDPYHNFNQAHGLAFSVKKGIAIPPSLFNIYKEVSNNCIFNSPNHGCLINWARQGVFLLNTILTVQAHRPNSHANIGWQLFTNKVIQKISRVKNNVVFMLWGSYAHKKQYIIDNQDHHYILKASHPSPFSAHYSFFGCNHFSLTNIYLKKHGIKCINWNVL